MQHHEEAQQIAQNVLQAHKQYYDKAKVKTLQQSINQVINQTQKIQRQNGLCNNSTERTSFKLKFNTSYDNLRCFISQSKPQRYRSVSTRLSKQSKSHVYLSNTKTILKSFIQIQQNKIEISKSQNQKQQPHSISQQAQDGQEGDISTILSNQIIHSIEKKGIDYDWSDIQEIKSQEILSENDCQSDLYEIFDTFPDLKTRKRLSFQQNQIMNSVNIFNEDCSGYTKSFNTQESQRTIMVSSQNYAMYQNYDKNYSFASTMEPYSNLYYPMPIYQRENQTIHNSSSSGLKSMPSSMFHSNQFIIRPQGLLNDPRTTLMIKNIPNKYTITFLSDQMDQDFGMYYDFLYLPCDTKSGANQGYGFINFIDLHAIKRFYQKFHGKKWRRFKSQKICNLTYARLQGIDSLIEHFQNSKVLNHKEKKYQPIIKSLPQIHHLIKKQQKRQQEQK